MALFLNPSAPLYGRASKVLVIGPMGYLEFCKACGFAAADMNSFLLFSMVSAASLATGNLSKRSAILFKRRMTFISALRHTAWKMNPGEFFPMSRLRASIPSAFWRQWGAAREKPSEIAARLEIPQTQLSKVFSLLTDADILHRDTPFGEGERNPKNVLYKIQDRKPAVLVPSLFFASVPLASVFSSREGPAAASACLQRIRRLLSKPLSRQQRSTGKKTANGILVLGSHGPSGYAGKMLIVGEVKFKKLTIAEKAGLLHSMQNRWPKTKLGSSALAARSLRSTGFIHPLLTNGRRQMA